LNLKILLLAALGLVVCLTVFFWPGDEKKIKANLTKLADYCSTHQEEAVMESLQKAAMAAKLCADPCTVQVESLKIDRAFKEKELMDHFLLLKKNLANTTFKFYDTIIDPPGGNKAEVATTLRISGKIADEQMSDAYEITILLAKKDGDWRFTSFTVVEFMKK
jgi:hypothetical protein